MKWLIKWILTFLIGALCGAGALMYFMDITPSVLLRVPVNMTPIAAPRPPIAARSLPVAAPVHAAAIGSTPAAIPPAAPSISAQHPSQPERMATPPAESLLIPVAGVKASQLVDTFNQPRGSAQRHEAIDIAAPKGTQVFAAADGKVVKLFNSKAGGLTLYQFDATEKFSYYYAHLDHYAASATEGAYLKRGDLVGYVGYTGNANPTAPHLHFAIFELTSEKNWWQGTPINPYPLLQQ